MAKNVHFDCFDIDLAGGRLFKGGVRVRLPDKPFQVLAVLVQHAGEVVSRKDLQRRLWPDGVFVDFEDNLNTAIGKLREALGDSAGNPRFIETLPKRGYRFIAAVCDTSPLPPPLGARARRRWHPAAGLTVPGTRWLLEEKLGEGGFGEVWLARHQQLKEPHVFKFCLREDRVRALKREMTLFRVWRAQVGDHPHLVKLLGVNFDQPPFYLEEEYVSGRDLRTWCDAQGGIPHVPVGVRLELMAQAAEGLAAVHEAGIIHRDIKPGNILISCWKTADATAATATGDQMSEVGDAAHKRRFPEADPGLPTAKLADFGIGNVISEEVLNGITATSLTTTHGSLTSSAPAGTHAYLAPEVLIGHPATVQSDVYAIGVVLYQLLVEDFAQPVTTDWGRTIPDAVEREDLQRCFAGRPEERFRSARELAEHLRSMAARREARAHAVSAPIEQGSTVASLAVLPFANLGADPDNEFFGDGLADDLLTALSRVSGLRVPGRTSCFAFKGKTEDLRRIGQALGVETVLEGSVRREGGRLRISVQLIKVADGFHLWSERYDREMADVFAIQDEITQAITAALLPKLACERPATRVKRYTRSIDAYELCLRARYHYQRRTPDGLCMALRLFEEAIARDPGCAPAYAGVSLVCLLSSYFGVLPTSEGMPRAKAAALRAVELDDTLAIAHVRLADALCFNDWDWTGAQREFLRALELDPDSPEALCRYGLFLWARLRYSEALPQLHKALELDPFSLDTSWFLGWVYLSSGQLDKVEEIAGRMLSMEPNLWTGYHIRACVRWAKALRADAISDYARVAAIEGGGSHLAVLCWFCVKDDRLAEARQTLERLEQLASQRYVPPIWLAVAYDALGADAQARTCLERAVEQRDLFLVHLRGWMALIPLLSGYRSVLDEYGL